MKTCTKCNATQPEDRTSSCAICKSNSYFRKLGYDVEQICKTCGSITRVYSNQECGKCLKASGLKECNRCKEIKPDSYSFHVRKGLCKDCIGPLWNLSKKERARNQQLLREYGISLDGYRKMLEEQGGKCKICHKTPKVLVVDHSHSTGQIRGLLCHGCNIGIGNLKESAVILAAAAEYLKNEPTQKPELASNVASIAGQMTASITTELDLRGEIDRLREEIEDLESGLRHQRTGLSADLILALIAAFRRKLQEEESETNTKGVAWLDSLIPKVRI